jgi:hypothetical protein
MTDRTPGYNAAMANLKAAFSPAIETKDDLQEMLNLIDRYPGLHVPAMDTISAWLSGESLEWGNFNNLGGRHVQANWLIGHLHDELRAEKDLINGGDDI